MLCNNNTLVKLTLGLLAICPISFQNEAIVFGANIEISRHSISDELPISLRPATRIEMASLPKNPLVKILSDPGTIDISWTAPGDDGDIGVADHYIIKYSTDNITDVNWDSASPAANPPLPLPAGSIQNFTLPGLNFGQYYYVAIKSYDDAGNVSPISNVVGKYASGIPSPIPLGVEIDSLNNLARLNAQTVIFHSPVYYEFALDTNIIFTNPTINIGLVADSGVTAAFDNLSRDTQYFWRCRAMAFDYSDSSFWSNPDSFQIGFADNQAPSVQLISPNGRERWDATSYHVITWSDSDNVGIDSYKLEYSLDSGNTWFVLCDWTSADSGSSWWNLPDSPSRQARVKVSCRDLAGNIASDISDRNFTIRDIIRPHVSLLFPNGGDSLEVGLDTLINWTATDNIAIDSFMIEYSIDGGLNWDTITSWVAGNPGFYSWSVPRTLSGQGLLRMSCVDPDSNISSDTSDSYFYIYDSIDPTVEIMSPADGDTLSSDTVSISWNVQDNGEIVEYAILYTTDSGQNWIPIVNGNGDSSQYLWSIPAQGTDFGIIVLCADAAQNIGQDTTYFYMMSTGLIENPIVVPAEFFLSQNYPNPFNPSTVISYGLPLTTHVILEIYDILGSRVVTLLDESQSAGFHSATWHAEEVPTGIYFYRLKTNEFQKVGKAALLK